MPRDKSHQFLYHPSLGMPIPKPRFRTAKHRGQAAGAFGGRTKVARAAMTALISALAEAIAPEAPAPVSTEPLAAAPDPLEPMVRKVLDDQMARAVDVAMAEIARDSAPSAPIPSP